jgi:hypothetical protein
VRIRRLLPLLLIVAVTSGCSSVAERGSPLEVPTTPAPTTTTTLLTGKPIDAADISVFLDPDGRPYDSSWDPEAVEVETERFGTLVVPGGSIRTVGGEYAPYWAEDTDPTVSFGDAEELDVSVIWESTGGDAARQVLGIRLDVPDTAVERWLPLESAYGTDGGTGGIVAAELAATEVDDDAAERELWDIIDELTEDTPVVTRDLDGTPGDDVLVFSNGYGDGGYPMSQGVDADGNTVALIVWDTRYPWRLAVPDGTPPPDVTEREDQLQQCLDGERGLVDASYGSGEVVLRCSQD